MADHTRGIKTPPKMVLLRNHKSLFHSHVQTAPDRISLRLQRAVTRKDYMKYKDHGQIEVVIGPSDIQLDEATDGFRDDVITIRVIIMETNEFRCERVRKEACMFPEDTIEIRQWENRNPRHILLSVPSINTLCPDLKAHYSITVKDINEQLLSISPNKLEIKTSNSLDREKYGTDIRFVVTCRIEGLDRRSSVSHKKEGTLKILDEDDSPPIRSRNPEVEWHYRNKTYDLDDQLMVLDPDSLTTNNYKLELIGNTYNLVMIESVNKFNLRKELCNQEAENVTGYTFSAECTVLTPVMSFDETKMRKKVPQKISFSVAFIDKTLRNPQASRQVAYTVNLTLPPCEDDAVENVVPTSWPHIEQETPPMEYFVNVTKPVSKLYRLGQLISSTVPVATMNINPPDSLAFVVAPESRDMGVGVTPITGIIFVDDPEELKSGDVKMVRGDIVIVVSIEVNIRESDPCPVLEHPDEREWCSSNAYNTSCETSCGLASSSFCSWRPYYVSETPYSDHYATCSPDLSTCPNGICDELEYSFMGICPQDCADASDIRGATFVQSGPGGRGIAAGLGLCTCDREGTCQCFAAPEEQPPPDPDQTSVTKKPRVPRAGCDRGCQIGVTISGLFFILITVISVLYCKRRSSRGGKQKGGVISLGALPIEERSSSLAYTRDEPHDTVHHGIRSSPRPEHNFVPSLNVTQIDRKWEFPRNRLVIEQTLGEGEFGKVMRAKAQGINGTLGYTTVAVKMLKSNSTPAELNDLLSEYSLLKEVGHPNVVKLLGACTLKGGPIYIIIEYCQYGSLRNYLKRSRHAEFENRVGSGPVEGTTADYNVSPKDILSFAWQISKGMAYLADMKLVHRDLAARNVLLASGKVCKISDFGLTRDVYEGDLYFKRSKGRVPVKWMALESLVDHVYTSKSDVWGFGVLLWELVTLGTLPYPGVQPERLFTLLKAGYRMEKPENCSQELYDVMLQCWAESPARRPCFQDLTEIFEGMIQADVEYLELRSLIVTNRSYFDSVPEPPQQFQDAPPQIRVAPEHLHDASQLQEHSETSPDSSPQMDDLQNPELDWSPPSGHTDADAYLVARTDIRRPCREESTEPLLASITPTPTAIHTPTITTSHAHNPAYSPTSEILPPPLHYSTLASRPDEEDVNTLECCRSEEDSDSGRATGDSGYATEEGRGRWKGDHKGGSCRAPLTSPRGSSYSPIPRHSHDHDDDHDPEDDQDTSEDLEERQELLNEDLLGNLTPSPEPAHTAHSTRTAHSSHAAHNAHTTPVIV